VVRGDPIPRGLTLMLDTQTDNTIGEPLNFDTYGYAGTDDRQGTDRNP
jgi:hypothetical protein